MTCCTMHLTFFCVAVFHLTGVALDDAAEAGSNLLSVTPPMTNVINVLHLLNNLVKCKY